MNIKLLHLFHPSPSASADGLQQFQREAIIDLLNFCRIADEKLLVAEEEAGAAVEAPLSWESPVPLVTYGAQSLVRAEQSILNEESRAQFIQSVADRLNTTELKTRAVSICLDMFYADREFVEKERQVFREIKRALGWPDGT